MTLHATVIDLEEITEAIVLLDDGKLRNKFEGKVPRYLICRIKGHIKAKWPQATENETTSSQMQEPTKTNIMEPVAEPTGKQANGDSNQMRDTATESFNITDQSWMRRDRKRLP